MFHDAQLLTNLSKDLEAKGKIDAEANVLEYGVVNLKKMQLGAFRSPDEDSYFSMQTLTNSTICPIAFPEIEIAIDRILSQLDQV